MICGSGANPNSPSSGCPKRSKTHEPPKGSTGCQNCCLPAPKTTGVRDGHLVPTSDSRDLAMAEWRPDPTRFDGCAGTGGSSFGSVAGGTPVLSTFDRV